ncbi:WD repeat-containing protein 44-like [Carica papaya]|uniref:WD repeat-containing protein 44-like n=1 Tax=Carica papaya TaxID=3649 RepID=UPI000B8C9F24|nr:WD repeat-containing protein 44-like [Carica papaya]XP_021899900.1 WD repeat-containing protein 44-like [Carica papaya]XP_021899901.1 WD repeat-containing protein 44-like [Carica papaya]XP_021899902.1 WD repeat-containing protein 44-like [Carica papaya]XP_021899903.1 WD repeat-containing protein 44-like [Carica papaya]
MLHSLEEEDDLFFDSADFLSSEETTVANDLQFKELDYEIWLSEPRSVDERRDDFLQRMGFIEVPSRNRIDKSSQEMGLESVRECNEAASSSTASSVERAEDNSVFIGREMNFEANSMVDDEENFNFEDTNYMHPLPANEIKESQAHIEEFNNMNKKMKSWWKRFLSSKERNEGRWEGLKKPNSKARRIKVQQNKKRCMELTGLYLKQEIQAHGGCIKTMKFSPDGQYLASGGEDGVVRIWRVMSTAASFQFFNDGEEFSNNVKTGKSGFGGKKSTQVPIIIPEKVFHIDETPFQELRGHSSDVLDLAWSNSNHLLSSSMDKTVRLWQVDCGQCQSVFRHNNYVTCIQFNPVDENYFISGSIDGKARIWGVSERRVVSWADIRDVISAICYRPDGKGFVVGSITGTCRFYQVSGSGVELEAHINIQGRKKTSTNKITGIQFCRDEPRRVMISSDDSKLRIFDGVDVVKKFKGLSKSKSQMSASFTPSGKHIISVGEDCRVYVWNYNGINDSASKHKKSVRSFEHFFYEGVSVAVPWSAMGTDKNRLGCSSNLLPYKQTEEHRGSERFSVGRWFSMDGTSKGSATWPEEKLPLWDLGMEEDDDHGNNNPVDCSTVSETWGLVVVTAGWDGRIRIFHNFGLPVRI